MDYVSRPDIFDAVVVFVRDQIDEAFFAQRLQTSVSGCAGHMTAVLHRLQDRDLLAEVPRRGETAQHPLF